MIKDPVYATAEIFSSMSFAALYGKALGSRVQAHGLDSQRQVDPSSDHARRSELSTWVGRSNVKGKEAKENERDPRGPQRA